MKPPPAIRPAGPGDYDDLCRLLTANDLPIAGLDPALDGFLVAHVADGLVGACGVERAGDYGLLRSAVVDPAWRGYGIGRDLVEGVISGARERNLRALYLLTTTAADWFPAFGFVVTDRAAAPEAILETEEFSHACPASAALLRLDLPPSPAG